MLQFIVSGTNSAEIIDTAKAALKNACQWIRLDVSLLPISEQDNTIDIIRQSCKEYDAILTVENDVEAVKRLKLDGLHLTNPSISAVDARKDMGEEPIIGVTINNSSEVPFVPRAAVDYIEIDKNVDDVKVQSEIVEQMKSSGRDEPVIAHFGFIPTLSMLRASGVNGVSLDSSNTEAVELKDLIIKLELLAEERINSL
ncbi:MAG: thiamine phosphate synthase [Muribaculaceae bacterium]|nr:thiamine phosphate synthase [Muribaculaceae bacterium]